MKNVIFYHLFTVNDWLIRFQKTYQKIKESELFEEIECIFVIIVGPDKECAQKQLNSYNKVIVKVKDIDTSEAETLKELINFSEINESNILYLHSKGVTKSNSKPIQDWIDYMEYFLIQKYKTCLKELENHDVIGLNFYEKPWKHFSGNFWWTKTEHIKKLKNINPVTTNRMYCEHWILDCKKDFKFKELFQSGINHYYDCFPKEKYCTNN